MKFNRTLLLSLLLTFFVSVGATIPHANPNPENVKRSLKALMNESRWDHARQELSLGKSVLAKKDYIDIFCEFCDKKPNDKLTSVLGDILENLDSFPAMKLDKHHPWMMALRNRNSALIALFIKSKKFDLASLITPSLLEVCLYRDVESFIQVFSLTKPDILRRFASEKNEVGFLAASFLYFHPLSPEMPPASGLDADFKLRLENLKAGDHNVVNCPEPQRLALASCAAAWGRVKAFQDIYATAQLNPKKQREFVSIAIAMAALYENIDFFRTVVFAFPTVDPIIQGIGKQLKNGIEQPFARDPYINAINGILPPNNCTLYEEQVILMFKRVALHLLRTLGQATTSPMKGVVMIGGSSAFSSAVARLSHDLYLKRPLSTDEKFSAINALGKFIKAVSTTGIVPSVKKYVNHLGMSTIGATPFFDCKQILKDQHDLLLRALGSTSTIPNEQKQNLFHGSDAEVLAVAKQLFNIIAKPFSFTDQELMLVENLVQVSHEVHQKLVAAWLNYENQRSVKNCMALYDAVMELGGGSTLLEVATKEIARLEAAKITTDRDGSGSESDSGSDSESESGSDSDDTDEDRESKPKSKPKTGKRKPTTRKPKPTPTTTGKPKSKPKTGKPEPEPTTTGKPKPRPAKTGKPKPAETGKPKPADPANPTNASDTTTTTTDNTTTSTSDASQNSSGWSIAMYILLAVVVLLVIGGAVVFLHPGLRRSIMGGGSDYNYKV